MDDGNKDLAILADNRDMLLSVEVAMWLHMLGKFYEDFLKDTKDATKNAIKLPADLEQISSELYKLITGDWLNVSLFKFHDIEELKQNFTIEDLIKNHQGKIEKNDNSYVKLAIDAHGRGSSVEKGILENNSYYKQKDGTIKLASAFGYESDSIDPEIICKRRHELYDFLADELKKLKEHIDNATCWNVSNWVEWRLRFIKRLKDDFSITVAETRKPINDVSLWDQTMASVAFLKPSLAKILLKGKYRPPTNNVDEEQYKWRTLRIALDGLKFISKPRIGAVLTNKELIDDGFDNITRLIEVEYPIGFEIYRDINSILFMIPYVDDIDNILDCRCGEHNSFEDAIREAFNEKTYGEAHIDISMSEPFGRFIFFSGLEIAKEISPLSPTLGMLKEAWSVSREKCVICQARPQEIMPQKICSTCFERLKGRSREWATHKLDTTIWMNEVSDSNSEVALITAKFNLVDWLNGKMISTFRNVKENCDLTFADIADEIGNASAKGGCLVKLEDLKNLKSIAETHLDNLNNIKNILFAGESYDMPENEMLAMGVWRKPPSFARIHRVWKTTDMFWSKVSKRLEDIVNKAGYRVKIKGNFAPIANSNIDMYTAYKARIGNTTFDIYYDGDGYIIIENLPRLAKRLGIELSEDNKALWREQLTNTGAIEIIGDDANAKIGSLEISDVVALNDSYPRIIYLLHEPQYFSVLVPADKALDIVHNIREMYEQEMGKVRNRLPLFLGIVFAKHNAPMNTLLDISYKMVKIGVKSEDWPLSSVEHYDNHHKLNFENGVMWDIEDDIWHSNFYIACGLLSKLQDRPTAFRGPDGYLVNAKDLREGDIVTVYPSLFDFEYADASARRFEVSYDEHNKRRNNNNRPYLLEELDSFYKIWNTLQQKLAYTQIKRIVELAETKRFQWQADENDAVFLGFVHDMLNNASWQNGKPDNIEEIAKVAASGKLKDIVELYSQVLPQGNSN